MSNINTLQAYDDLIAAGVEENQARAQVNTLNIALDGLVTKEDLKNGLEMLETKLEVKIDSKFATVKALGWAIFAALCLPTLQNFFTWQSVLKHFAK